MVVYDSRTTLFDSNTDTGTQVMNQNVESSNDITTAVMGRNASAQALLDTKDREHYFKVPKISRNERGLATKTTEQNGDDFIASGGAPLRSSYKSLAKRSSKKISIQQK